MSDYVICVFGAGGVGKSCLTMQFVQGVFMLKYDPTIEDVYKTNIEVDEKQYSLEILDTAGTDEFSAMKDLYVKNADGFLLVYSITSQATFNAINEYYDRIVAVKDIDTYGRPAIVLVGNKNDLQNERVVSRESGQSLAKKWNCNFLETSAKDRANVIEVFNDLVRQMNRKGKTTRPNTGVSRKYNAADERVEFHMEPSTSKSSIATEKKDSGCCCILL